MVQIPLSKMAKIKREIQMATDFGNLTERQREIVQLTIKGKQQKEIADKLCISIRTVKFHMANALRKLDMDRSTLLAGE